MMLGQAMEPLGEEDGICIRYRTDGSLFNQRHPQACTKTMEHLIRELLFADDAALVEPEPAKQHIVICLLRLLSSLVSKSA